MRTAPHLDAVAGFCTPEDPLQAVECLAILGIDIQDSIARRHRARSIDSELVLEPGDAEQQQWR